VKINVLIGRMKNIFLLFIGLFYTVNSFADCRGEGLYIFPSGKTIKQNSVFVLDGYARSQDVILGLNKKYPIYLESGEQKVKLFVKETFVGQFELTQAILTLEKPLEAGLEYTLVIDNLPKTESLDRYNPKTNIYELIKFTVESGVDIEKPVITSSPKLIDKSYAQYGCGPAMSVNFSFPVKDNSEIIIKTVVKNIKSGIETTYCIVHQNKQIEVGHGMCSGAFIYGEGNEYEVAFSFMDASGNITAWQGDRIKFTKPSAEHLDEWKKKKKK